MADISAGRFASEDSSAAARGETILTTLLSALLIVGFPAAFWIAIMEFVNYVLALGLVPETRLLIATTLIGTLGLIWCFIHVSARQRNSASLEASLMMRKAA